VQIVNQANRKQGRLGRRKNDASAHPQLSVPTSPTDVPVPPSLRASHIELAGDSYVVLSFPAPSWDLPECLTSAEREVARAVLGGATNDEIAERRSSSERTVAHQIASIFEKLSVSSRAELASLLAARTLQHRS
jgi:DNA-binding NarL/FixJ family response regulator